MSLSKFIAKFEILSATDYGNNEWLTVGNVTDSSVNSFSSSDVQAGDVFFDESEFDSNVNRWKVIQVISTGSSSIAVRCRYDEDGEPTSLFGGPQISEGAICRTTIGDVSYVPSETWAQISESIKIAIMNLNKTVTQNIIEDSRTSENPSRIKEIRFTRELIYKDHEDFEINFDGSVCEIVNGRLYIEKHNDNSFSNDCELTFYSKASRRAEEAIWRSKIKLGWTRISQTDLSIGDNSIKLHTTDGFVDNDLALLSVGGDNYEYVRIEKVGSPIILRDNLTKEHLYGEHVSLCNEFSGFKCVNEYGQKELYARITFNEKQDLKIGISLNMVVNDAMVSSSSSAMSSPVFLYIHLVPPATNVFKSPSK